MTTLTDFLAAFFPDEDEKIYLRAFKAKGASNKPDNRAMVKDTTRRKLAADAKLQAKMTDANKTRGWYFVVNGGGNADGDIIRFNAFFCEGDDLPISEQHALLDRAPIPTSIRIETLKSVHAYWLNDGDCSETQWRDVQARLIAVFNSDTTIKNPSRVMRLPFFNYVFVNDESYGYKKVELKQFNPERRYSVEAMFEAFSPVATYAQAKADSDKHSRTNSGYANWPALKSELGRRVMAHPKAKQNKQGKWDCRGICHGGKGSSGLFYDPATNGTYCNKNCDEATILRAFGLPDRPDNGDTELELATDFNLRAQAIISANSTERDDLIRLLVSDLISDADSLTIDRIGMSFKEAKVLSLTLWRQLVKYERDHKREKQKIAVQEQDEAKRATRLQELVKTECDLTTIHRKLTYTTSSPYSHDVIELAIATSISHQLIKKVLLWLLIVGPPSSDKTQTALAIKDAPQVFHLDTLTENSFIRLC